MFKKWDERFDAVCGANLRHTNCTPQADSGVKDWLYGTAECLCEEQAPALPVPPAAVAVPAEAIWQTQAAARTPDLSRLVTGRAAQTPLPRSRGWGDVPNDQTNLCGK